MTSVSLFRKVKHLKRYREIANVFASYGLTAVVHGLGLDAYLPLRRMSREQSVEKTTAECLRLALLDLGPAFVKMGQLLSTRSDFLPPEFSQELAKLQDRGRPLPWDTVEEVLQAELGEQWRAAFTDFVQQPLGVASIAQVHRARLSSGEEVVVKIQRPGIREIIETDLEIMFDIARYVQERTQWGRFYDLIDLVQEFAYTMRNEFNFITEARNTEIIRQNMQRLPRVVVPRIYWPYTTNRVITQEYVPGVKYTEVATLRRWGVNGRDVALTLSDAIFQQIFLDGVFHADPHPGNIYVLPDGRVAMLDFGMVGHLAVQTRRLWVDMILALGRQDAERVADIALRLEASQVQVNRRKFTRAIQRMLERYVGLPFGEMHLGQALGDLMGVIREFHLMLSAETFLVIKTLVMLEGAVPLLDPTLNIMTVAEQFNRRLAKEKIQVREMREIIAEGVRVLRRYLATLPAATAETLEKLSQGQLEVRVRISGVDKLMRHLHMIANRLALSLIVASLIVGSAIVSQHAAPPFIFGLSLFDLGFISSTVLGVVLLYSIFKSRR